MESEIVSRNIINKIIAIVVCQSDFKQIENKIGNFSYDFYLNSCIKPLIHTQFISYTVDDSDEHFDPQSKERPIFYDNPPPEINTWEVIKEPAPSIVNCDCSALINFGVGKSDEFSKLFAKKIDTNKVKEVEEKETPKFIPKKSFFKSKLLTKKDNSKDKENEDASNVSVETVDLPCYTMEDFKVEEQNATELNFLRKEFEEQKERNIIEKKKEEEIKHQEIHEQKVARLPVKAFDPKKYTFDSKGNVIQYKIINPQNFSKDFFTTSVKIKTKEKKLKPLPQTQTEKINQKTKRSSLKSEISEEIIYAPSSLGTEPSIMRREPTEPAGSSYHIMLPEVGVKITEGKLNKGGDREFSKKFNKISINDYNKYLLEYLPEINKEKIKSFKSFAMMDKSSSILSSSSSLGGNVNKTEIMGTINPMKSSNNPLMENMPLSQLEMSNDNIDNKISYGINQMSTRSENELKLSSASIYGLKYTLDNIEDLDLAQKLEDSKSTRGKDLFNRKYMSPDYSLDELNEGKTQDKFNKKILIDQSWGNIKPGDKSPGTIKKPKNRGNKLLELGKSIVDIKLPRSRKFNHLIKIESGAFD